MKNEHGIESPQKALVFYERFFVTHSGYVRDVKFPLRGADSGVPLPADYILPEKVAILTEKGEVKPIFPKPNKKPKNSLSAEELDKPVEFIKRSDNEPYDAPKPPRTLDELKALCPAEITDKIERAQWIGKERQKYGI